MNESYKQTRIIKEAVYNYIKEHNGKCDLVDVACQFNEYTIDVPGLAVHELIEEGKVERSEGVGNRLYVKD
ncbi:MAG: hypothetical protein ABFC18_09150 [Rikenellaceae bacterium]